MITIHSPVHEHRSSDSWKLRKENASTWAGKGFALEAGELGEHRYPLHYPLTVNVSLRAFFRAKWEVGQAASHGPEPQAVFSLGPR